MDVELDLANIIKAISFAEITLENQRIRLAENPNFDINSVFVEQKPKNCIDYQELMDFLSVYRIALTPRECEYLINLSAETANVMTFSSFHRTILPKTDKKLFAIALNKRKSPALRTYNQHFSSESTVKAVSEREIARLLSEELRFYRDLEKLKRDFQENHAISLRELFKLIDFKEKGYLDYESLYNFMAKLKVLFTKDEYFALLRRIAVNLDNKIEYQELVHAVFPNEPYDYPAFRRETSGFRDIFSKPREFGYEISEETLKFQGKSRLFAVSRGKSPDFTGFPRDLQRKHYIYDESYHKELHDYRAKYVAPAKNATNLAKSRKNKGVCAKSLDDCFEDYLFYLRDREKTEEFFNKYGKRYAFRDNLREKPSEKLAIAQKLNAEAFRAAINERK